jgi:hypothetical protein
MSYHRFSRLWSGVSDAVRLGESILRTRNQSPVKPSIMTKRRRPSSSDILSPSPRLQSLRRPPFAHSKSLWHPSLAFGCEQIYTPYTRACSTNTTPLTCLVSRPTTRAAPSLRSTFLPRKFHDTSVLLAFCPFSQPLSTIVLSKRVESIHTRAGKGGSVSESFL